MTLIEGLEWFGAILGCLGAILMSLRVALSPYAFVLWAISSVALLVFAVSEGHSGLAMQQACFTVINAIGIYRWLVEPAPLSELSLTTNEG